MSTLDGKNYAGAEEENSVNNAFLHVEGEEGHTLANEWMLDLAKTFTSIVKFENGPKLITRVAKRICGTNEIMEIVEIFPCLFNFKVLPIETAYNIRWAEMHKFFDDKFTDEVFDRLQSSVITHLWNSGSANRILDRDSDAPYVQLAKNYCPHTIAASFEF